MSDDFTVDIPERPYFTVKVEKLNVKNNPMKDLERWIKGTKILDYCSVVGCMNRDLVGVHVIYDNIEYIVPFCKEHAQQQDREFHVRGDVIPLSVK